MISIKDKWLIGFTTTDYLLLDLDNADYDKVKALCEMLTKEYDLGSFVIMRSSASEKKQYKRIGDFDFHKNLFCEITTTGSYHVIFGRKINYDRICRIIETLANLGVLNNEYANIRQWRGDVTLRISADNSDGAVRPIPVLQYAYYLSGAENNEGIELYNATLRAVKSCLNQTD